MDQIKQEWQELEKLGVNIVVLDNPVLNTEKRKNVFGKKINRKYNI